MHLESAARQRQGAPPRAAAYVQNTSAGREMQAVNQIEHPLLPDAVEDAFDRLRIVHVPPEDGFVSEVVRHEGL